MGYQCRTIKQVLPDINESIFLPAIQREFVWDTEQIVQLFDSVLREYPIGSFIFWNLNGEFADNQIKYYFVRNHIEDSIYPDDFDNVHHRNRRSPNTSKSRTPFHSSLTASSAFPPSTSGSREHTLRSRSIGNGRIPTPGHANSCI